jgi:hypothetical protein
MHGGRIPAQVVGNVYHKAVASVDLYQGPRKFAVDEEHLSNDT